MSYIYLISFAYSWKYTKLLKKNEGQSCKNYKPGGGIVVVGLRSTMHPYKTKNISVATYPRLLVKHRHIYSLMQINFLDIFEYSWILMKT